MNRKSFRNFLCAAATVAFGAFGTSAHAVHYDVGFDPPPTTFAGIVQINVPDPCFLPAPGENSCAFDVLSLFFTDSLGREWDILGPQLGIGDKVSVDSIGTLVGIQVLITGLNEVTEHEGPPCGDFSPRLQFQLDSENASLTHVDFSCGTFSDTGSVTTITKVPEPASLALLGVGLGGIAWARRRKRS